MSARIISILNKIHPAVWLHISIATSTIVFTLIILNRSPNFLRPVSMALRTGFGLVIPITALIVYLTFRIPGPIGKLLSMTTTLALFALPLAGLWASGQTQSTVLSGLIPLYDAATYYVDALGLTNGSNFSIFSARRPLFPGLLAFLLTITDHNLMASLAILTGITGMACYLTAREIQHTHGAETSTFVLIVLFLFYRAHSGISMSENLGVALGALGFGLIWRGAAEKNHWTIWLGLLTTTLGLNARAGAFFILPLLVIWAGRLFRHDKFVSSKALLISTTAIVLGFGLNLMLTRLIAVPAGVPFANFSYTLYGLASGGKSWIYVFEAHPELTAVQEPEQSKRIYELAYELIRENPAQAVSGAFYNWKMLFSNTWYNVYSYVGGENWKVNVTARWAMYLLSILGLFTCLKHRREAAHSLVLACIVGVFISVPFLPPTDAYRMRPYAANIVILAILPAMGFALLLNRAKITRRINQSRVLAPDGFAATFSLVLIFAILGGPVAIKSYATQRTFTPTACSSDSEPVVVRFAKGTYINIQKQNLAFLDWMPNYHVSQFRANSHSLPDGKMITWAGTIDPANTIFLTLDYLVGQGVMIVTPTRFLPVTNTFIQMCGQYQIDYDLKIFYASEIKIFPE